MSLISIKFPKFKGPVPTHNLWKENNAPCTWALGVDIQSVQKTQNFVLEQNEALLYKTDKEECFSANEVILNLFGVIDFFGNLVKDLHHYFSIYQAYMPCTEDRVKNRTEIIFAFMKCTVEQERESIIKQLKVGFSDHINQVFPLFLFMSFTAFITI